MDIHLTDIASRPSGNDAVPSVCDEISSLGDYQQQGYVSPDQGNEVGVMGWWPFGKRASTELSPEAQQIFDKVLRFLDDETVQNNTLPENFRDVLLQNLPCDQIASGFGEFGRTLTNPVPVNGPVGELVYLSRLETTSGTPIAFHRLGAHGNVDMFETVSADGQHWDLLFLSLYFPRKSRAVPSGYRITTDRARRAQIRGTTQRVDSFPKGIFHATLECTNRVIGIPIGDSNLKAFDTRSDIVRSKEQVATLRELKFTSQPSAGTTTAADKRDYLADLFNQTFEQLNGQLKRLARKVGLQLNDRFERELTYVVLYVFVTFLFSLASGENPTTIADQLTEQTLTNLAKS